MRPILLMCMLSTQLHDLTQTLLGIHTELAQSLKFQPGGENMYLDSDFNLGLQYNGKKGSVTIYGKYRFGGIINNQRYTSNYNLHYHAFGAGVKYRILNQERKVSPYIKLELAWQAQRRNGIRDTFYMDDSTRPRLQYDEYGGGTKLYNRMKLMASIYLGVDFKIVENLYANLNFGIEYSTIEYKRKYPYTGDPAYAKHYPTYYQTTLGSISTQISLSAAIPVLKKER